VLGSVTFVLLLVRSAAARWSRFSASMDFLPVHIAFA
jgi:hypothetical protein